MRQLFLLTLTICASFGLSAQHSTFHKTGGVCFRVDDHQGAAKWRDWNNLFNANGLKFSLAINASRLYNDTAAVNALREIAAAGHELMDHTPDHHMGYFTVKSISDTVAYSGNPAVDHINGTKVCLKVDAPYTDSYIGEGTVNLIGNKLISVNNGGFGGINGNPYYALIYLPGRNQYGVYTTVNNKNSSDPDTLTLQTYWQENWKNDTAYGISYHRITTQDVKSNAQANLLLAQRSKDLFAFYGLPAPKTWIQPGGSYALLNRFEVQAFSMSLGYTAGAENILSAQKCYNEVDSFANRRYSMQGPDFYEESNNYQGLINIISDRSARHYNSFGLSHMTNVAGGWAVFLGRVDSLLKWCNQNQIPVRTYNQWGSILFDSVPNQAANVLPAINKDLNNNNYPDGYNSGALYDVTDGLAISGNKCFSSASNNAILAAISNLGGLEKGENLVSMYTKGMPGDSIRMIITYPELSLPTQLIMFPANTTDWTLQKRMVNIPAAITRINVSWVVIKRTNPGAVKMCGMEMRKSSKPSLNKGYLQRKIKGNLFDTLFLDAQVSDGYYAKSTLQYGYTGMSNFYVQFNSTMRLLEVQQNDTAYLGKDSLKIWVSNPDGMSDTAWFRFEKYLETPVDTSTQTDSTHTDTLVVVPPPALPSGAFANKVGGVCFRIDDQQSAANYRALYTTFQKYGRKLTLGINASKLLNDTAAVNALREMAAAGHELADHTPDHSMAYFNVNLVQDTNAYRGHAGVDHFNGKKVCLKIDSVVLGNYSTEGLVNINGSTLISVSNGEWKTMGSPVYYSNIYLPFNNKTYTYTNLLNKNANDPDTLTLQSYWGETVNLGVINGVAHHRLTQYDIKPSQASLHLLTQRTNSIFDSLGLPRPKTFLQPSGNYAMLSKAEVKGFYESNYGYTAGGVFLAPSFKCYNESDANADKRFGLHGPDFKEESNSALSIMGIIADNSAKHHNSFGLSMMYGMSGGLSGYISRCDSLLNWCEQNQIPVLTFNQWANIMYDSVPNPFVNAIPALQQDLNQNQVPDGYTGPFASLDTADGVSFSANRSYARSTNGTFCAIQNLGGIEKGANTFYISTKGYAGDSVRVTYSYPELSGSYTLMVPASTSAFAEYAYPIQVPANVSRITFSFAAVKRTTPGNIKISGMKMFANGNQKRALTASETDANVLGSTQSETLIYPNPFNENFSIVLPENTDLSLLKVYNLNGQEMSLSSSVEENSINIHLNEYSKGIYLLKYADAMGRTYSRKLIGE